MAKVYFVKIVLIAAVFLSAAAMYACTNGKNPGTDALELSAQSALSKTDAEESGVQENTGFAMGTVINQTVYSNDSAITSDVIGLLTRIENEWLSWRIDESEVARINAAAKSGESISISYESREYLNLARAIAEDSNGAFEPTIGYLSELWGFDEDKNIIPEDSEIKKMIEGVGYKHISVQGDKVSIPAGIAIDLGAVGKGIGCDEIESMLREKSNVTGGIFNIGGSSILTYGEKNNGDDWKVAITNPTSVEDFLGVIKISGTRHVSTSGDYEKYFEKDGKRYHHILDPKTGYPVDNDLRSVTVVSDSGTVSEGLSTACFVLGMENSFALLQKYGAEAIFVDAKKNVYLTDGLKSKFEILSDDYQVKSFS